MAFSSLVPRGVPLRLRVMAGVSTIEAVKLLLLLLLAGSALRGQTGANILLVVNRNSAVSSQIAAYYRPRRSIPVSNVCTLATTDDEEIYLNTYLTQIEAPIGNCLKKAGLTESVLYIVLTMGIPLKVDGMGGGMAREAASVDSELTLLYAKLKGEQFQRSGPIGNPFYMNADVPFRHPQFPIYLVTRLAAYDLDDVKAMIDRSLRAQNRGKFVIDLSGGGTQGGNAWLRSAATQLPPDRVVLDETSRVLYGQRDVIGYASWGSNDSSRRQRWLHNQWLPGAIATEFVSTSARTLKRPPDDWLYTAFGDTSHYWGGSPQGLTADFLHEGASGAAGNAYEPLLMGCARPDYVLPAYFKGRNLAESFYLGLPYVSWQGIVFGDPLCSLGKP
jgi:uncharacterized protein (TIGR03790 family)